MKKAKIALFAVVSFIQLFSLVSSIITCRNQADVPVEWFTVYKLPKLAASGWEDAKTGVAFLYQDSLSAGEWKQSEHLINTSSHLVSYTLNHLYRSNDDKLTYILYNENSPVDKKSHENVGHAKGFIIFDDVSGIWVTHTIPYFPPPKSQGYSYPSGGHNAALYGQTLFCASFPISELDKIARQLWHINPHIYDKQIPESVLIANPSLKLLTDNSQVPPEPYHSVLQLKTVANANLISFAKDSRLNTEIYSYFVAPTLGVGMLAQGWRHGGGNFPSTCSSPSTSVGNINTISLSNKNVVWQTKEDHSNWAVSADAKNEEWTCFGDLSRQFRSFERSGGVLCINIHGLWRSYRKLVSGFDPCNQRVGAEIEDDLGLEFQQNFQPNQLESQSKNDLLRRKKRTVLVDHDSTSRDGSWDVKFLPGYNGQAAGPWPFETRRWSHGSHSAEHRRHGSHERRVTSHERRMLSSHEREHISGYAYGRVIPEVPLPPVRAAAAAEIPVLDPHSPANNAAHDFGLTHGHRVPIVDPRGPAAAVANAYGIPHENAVPGGGLETPLFGTRVVPEVVGTRILSEVPVVGTRVLSGSPGEGTRVVSEVVGSRVVPEVINTRVFAPAAAEIPILDPHSSANSAAHDLGLTHGHRVPIVDPRGPAAAVANAYGIPHETAVPAARVVVPEVYVGSRVVEPALVRGRLDDWERDWSREHSWDSFERQWGRREVDVYNHYLRRWSSHERHQRERWGSHERHEWFRRELRRRWEELRRLGRHGSYGGYLASHERSAERSRVENRKWLNHEGSYENDDSRSGVVRAFGAEG